jgi:hypothetical protein
MKPLHITNMLRHRLKDSGTVVQVSQPIIYESVVGAGFDIIDDNGKHYRISVVERNI